MIKIIIISFKQIMINEWDEKCEYMKCITLYSFNFQDLFIILVLIFAARK